MQLRFNCPSASGMLCYLLEAVWAFETWAG